jgi:hypothetical protein
MSSGGMQIQTYPYVLFILAAPEVMLLFIKSLLKAVWG